MESTSLKYENSLADPAVKAKLVNALAEAYYKDPICPIINNRIPSTLNKNTLTQYQPSPESLALESEQNRLILSENVNWKIGLPPKLTDCCVLTLSRHFEKLKILNEIPCDDLPYLIEILPLNIPLDIVVPLIDHELYWKRRYENEFEMITYPKREDWKWKCLYLERYLRKIVEQAQPQDKDEYEMNEILELIEPYVDILRATQLQIWLPPLSMEKDDYPEFYPDDHIDFKPIFKKLRNLKEVNLVYGLNNVGMDFEWRMFNVAVKDLEKLGKAVHELKNLKILRIHRSKIEDRHCQALIKGLKDNKTLIELEISHCQIGDQGALCIAHLIRIHPTLQTLNLQDNRINGIGGEGIGYALVQENSCPLKNLNLKLNPLGHQGALGIMRALVRTDKIEKINFSCCQFLDTTSYIFGAMLRVNTSLTSIDVSCNVFGDFGAVNLIDGLENNDRVKKLDIRETNIKQEHLKKIKELLKRNNKEIDSEDEEELKQQEEEDDVENKEEETETTPKNESCAKELSKKTIDDV